MPGPDPAGPGVAAPGPVGVGYVGCGSIAQIHADGLAKLVEDGLARAVAAADPSDRARAAVNRNCAFGRLSGDPDDVIADPEVEAVLIAVPTNRHEEILDKVLSAGKAVVCEKPLAPTFAGVQRMCRAVSASQVVAQVGFHTRYHPMYRHLVTGIADGTWGVPMSYLLRDDQFFPSGDFVAGHSSWRHDHEVAGGGALLEHSIHAADVLVWAFGPPKRVFCRTRHAFGYGVEDSAIVTVEHQNGVIGSLVTVFNGVVGREERRMEVFFEHATMEITSDFVVGAPEDSMIVQRPSSPPEPVDLAAVRERGFAAMGIARRDFLFYQYAADRNWLTAIRTGGTGYPTFSDAFSAHALVEAAYRSAATDRPVGIEGDLAGEPAAPPVAGPERGSAAR